MRSFKEDWKQLLSAVRALPTSWQLVRTLTERGEISPPVLLRDFRGLCPMVALAQVHIPRKDCPTLHNLNPNKLVYAYELAGNRLRFTQPGFDWCTEDVTNITVGLADNCLTAAEIHLSGGTRDWLEADMIRRMRLRKEAVELRYSLMEACKV